MANIVFVGNCQMRAVWNIYRTFVSPSTRDTCMYVDAYEANPASTAIIETAEIVVGQVAEFKSNIDLDQLPSAIKQFRIPVVSGVFLWPFGGQAHPKSAKLPFLDLGPYPAEMGDLHLNRMIAKGVDPDEAVQRYLDLDIHKLVNLDRLLELNLEKQRNRDGVTGFNTADLIQKHFRDEHIFLTPYHPNQRVALYLIQQSFRQMGVGSALIDRVGRMLTVTPFPKSALPIHPSVCRHFGLKYGGEDYRYRYLSEGQFTFKEYARRYVRFEWNEELEEGLVLARTQATEAAIQKLYLGLKVSPASSNGHLAMSGLFDRLGQEQRAMESARRAAALDADNAHAVRQLGLLLSRAGDVDEAVRLLKRAIELEPGVAEFHHIFSRVLAQKNALNEAIAAARYAVELDPSYIQFRVNLANLVEMNGAYEEAEELFRSVLDSVPSLSAPHLALSRFLARRNRLQEAIQVALEATNLDPENAGAHGYLGHLFGRAGDLLKAERELQQAIKLAPETAAYYNELAHLLAKQGRNEEAIGVIRKAIALDSKNPGPYALLSNLHMRNSEIMEAEQSIRTATTLAPNKAAFHLELAQVLGRQEKFDEAITAARRAIEIEADAALPRARLGYFLLRIGDITGAEQELRRAVELAPKNASLLSELSHLLAHQGRLDEATSVARTAADLAPQDPKLAARLQSLLATQRQAQKQSSLGEGSERRLQTQLSGTDFARKSSHITPSGS